MDPLPPLLRDQRKVDADHLNLLAVFHFVGAGLALMGTLFLLLHFAIFQTVFANPAIWQEGTHPPQFHGPPPMAFFAIFRWFYLVMGLWFIGSGIVNVLSGLYLRSRKNRTFSIVVAGINCLHMPFGTVLGVFTIIVLSRDSVREVYEAPLNSAGATAR